MKRWNFFTSSEIKPEGWLRRQLEIQAKGLGGNLDKVWRDVRDSAWIGGDAEGWERVPYWLDGFVPLAYLLQDEDMIARAKKYIDAILAKQCEDGWICPCSREDRPTYDTWAVQLISKTLTVYYECSGDERALSAVYKTLKNYWELLSNGSITLFNWGKFRWFETFIALELINKKYPNEEWIVSLAKILKEQGTDFESLYETWKVPMNIWRYETHVVNLAMMLRSEALSCDFVKEKYDDKAQKRLDLLMKYHGSVTGIFTGDENLAGDSPIQGTELCAVVELMYGFERLFAYTGDTKWADLLERVAFNALPATISDDMWTHQYDQLVNQIACTAFKGSPIFTSNSRDAHLFGLEPNYGCCTANFSQGWPKLALSAFMYSQNEVISAVPVPSRLDCELCEARLETEYPFKNHLRYEIKAKKDMRFTVRIPSFAKSLCVNGKACEYSELISFELHSGSTETVEISFEAETEFVSRPNSLYAAKCGNLIFSMPVSYTEKMLEYTRGLVERKYPYCDYELIPNEDWGFGYSSKELLVERREVSEIPFSSKNPPVVLKAKLKPIDWGFEPRYDNICAKTPNSLEPLGEEREKELYPYGCAKLRLTEMPLLD